MPEVGTLHSTLAPPGRTASAPSPWQPAGTWRRESRGGARERAVSVSLFSKVKWHRLCTCVWDSDSKRNEECCSTAQVWRTVATAVRYTVLDRENKEGIINMHAGFGMCRSLFSVSLPLSASMQVAVSVFSGARYWTKGTL